jgi:hypothetical protein
MRQSLLQLNDSEAHHNPEETPNFAKSIERRSLLASKAAA